MPTISLRITNEQKEKLDAMVIQSGATQSAIVSSALNRALGIGRPDYPAYPAPYTLSNTARLILVNQCRILKELEADASEQYEDYERILLKGFSFEYYEVFSELYEELSYADCSEVLDILQMFQALKVSYEKLSHEEQQGLNRRHIAFQGFDYSDQRESGMALYADYLFTQERFQGLEDDAKEYSDDGNSHFPKLAMYQRMLHCYKTILRQKDLTVAGSLILSFQEIKEIVTAEAYNSGW